MGLPPPGRCSLFWRLAIPVVALTAYAMEADRRRGAEAGMDAYVTKPYDVADLMRAIRRVLSGDTSGN